MFYCFLLLRDRPKLSSFSRECTKFPGVNGCCMLFKNVHYAALHMHMPTGSLKNQHFQSTLLGGREGVTKESTLCMLLIMLTIMDGPLHSPLKHPPLQLFMVMP